MYYIRLHNLQSPRFAHALANATTPIVEQLPMLTITTVQQHRTPSLTSAIVVVTRVREVAAGREIISVV